jgi:hypothetical protein
MITSINHDQWKRSVFSTICIDRMYAKKIERYQIFG